MLASGDYVEVINNSYKKKYGFGNGTKGRITAVINIPDGEYVSFMPSGIYKLFVILSSSVIKIEEEEQQ